MKEKIKIATNNLKVNDYLLAFMFVMSIQFTDLKIVNIKLGEFFSLYCILYFTINLNLKLPYLLKRFFYVFSFFLVTSLIVLFWVKIYPISNVGFLRTKGWVSISRYIQNIGCVFFAGYLYMYLKKHSFSFNRKFILLIDKLMFAFGILFTLFYLLSFLGLESYFVYDGHRLKGGYVEGGPFALFYLFYITFRTILFGTNKYWLGFGLLIVIMSQSKSSVLFVIGCLVVFGLIINRIKFVSLLKVSISGIGLLLLSNYFFDLTDRVKGYVVEFANVEQIILERSNDFNLVMGRIAGAYIAPNIIKDNWFFGVGLGNYSLVRNNPEYLGPFPQILNFWDLTGLGGIVNTLIESGFLGLLLFIYPLYVVYKKSSIPEVKLGIIIFLMAQVFGVQTYFQYLWYSIGIICYIINNNDFIYYLRDKDFIKK